MRQRTIPILGAFALLVGCGQAAELKPAAGKSMPVKPLMARTTPTTPELLAIPQYAKPNRVDELVKKSQPRQQDPFDLPPPAGGAAPELPAGSEPASNTTMSSEPQ